MKNLIFLFGCFITTATLAQNNNSFLQKCLNPRAKAILEKQRTLASYAVANKTTAPAMRLTASSYRLRDTVRDSSHYYYSNGRGSEITDPSNYKDSYSPISYSDVQIIHCDSSISWGLWYGSTGPLTLFSYSSYVYGKMKPIQIDHFDDMSQIRFNISYTNDSVRNTAVESGLSGTSTSPYLTYYFNYNTSGNHIHDSVSNDINHTPFLTFNYTQDANGNLATYDAYGKTNTSTTLTKIGHEVYEYDSLNRLTSSTGQSFIIDSLQNDYKDTFIYSGKSPLYSTAYYYTWDNVKNDWAPTIGYHNNYNNNGFTDTSISLSFTSQWDTGQKYVYVYDATNRYCQNVYRYDYLGGGIYNLVAYDTQTYYFEQYIPSEVKNITPINIGFNLYPNPTNGTITFEAATFDNGNITIINSMGQVVYRQASAALNKQTIDIHQLPPGNYTLILQDSKGQNSYQRQFTKL